MSTTVEQLAELFAAAAGRIPDVRQALDHEPDVSTGLALPAITMLWTGFTQADDTTGPETTNTWTWDVNVYVPLEVGWDGAQRMLPRFVAAVMTIVREDPRLNEEADRLEISDGGSPQFVRSDQTGYLVKTLRLTATTTEV